MVVQAKRFVMYACGLALIAFVVPGTVLAAGKAELPQPQTWKVESAQSAIHFVSVKNGDVPVGGQFGGVSGTVTLNPTMGSGQGQLDIDIKSLDTKNPARDLNITSVFFGVARATQSENATFEIESVSGDYESLFGKAGNGDFMIAGSLNWKGADVALSIPTTAQRRSDGTIQVITRTPVPITFADLNRTAAAAELKKICGHAELLELAAITAELVLRAP